MSDLARALVEGSLWLLNFHSALLRPFAVEGGDARGGARGDCSFLNRSRPRVGPATSAGQAGREGSLEVHDLLDSREMRLHCVVLGTSGRKGTGSWLVSGGCRDGCRGSRIHVLECSGWGLSRGRRALARSEAVEQGSGQMLWPVEGTALF